EAVQQALHRPQHTTQESTLSLVDPRHVGAQGPGQEQEDGQEQYDIEDAGYGHAAPYQSTLAMRRARVHTQVHARAPSETGPGAGGDSSIAGSTSCRGLQRATVNRPVAPRETWARRPWRLAVLSTSSISSSGSPTYWIRVTPRAGWLSRARATPARQ